MDQHIIKSKEKNMANTSNNEPALSPWQALGGQRVRRISGTGLNRERHIARDRWDMAYCQPSQPTSITETTATPTEGEKKRSCVLLKQSFQGSWWFDKFIQMTSALLKWAEVSPWGLYKFRSHRAPWPSAYRAALHLGDLVRVPVPPDLVQVFRVFPNHQGHLDLDMSTSQMGELGSDLYAAVPINPITIVPYPSRFVSSLRLKRLGRLRRI